MINELSAFAYHGYTQCNTESFGKKRKRSHRKQSPLRVRYPIDDHLPQDYYRSFPANEMVAKRGRWEDEQPQKNGSSVSGINSASFEKKKKKKKKKNKKKSVSTDAQPPPKASAVNKVANKIQQIKKEANVNAMQNEDPKTENSIAVGEKLFSWMISPVEVEVFFKQTWEKKPLLITRHKKDFYAQLCTLKDLEMAFLKEDIYFTKNVDVTSYVNGVRTTENPIGKAKPPIVWDLYNKGKSIRLLNPQTFIGKIRKLTTLLQDFFRCFVGANMYLTPPNSQGFAPHYDDIEAFVLQLEGKKKWKLYNPRSPEEVLPRESSENFTDKDIGKPILEVTLEPGDLLYFPRGIIHQAECAGEHSLHITVSCYQRNSWADFLEKAVPAALQRAIEEDVEFREGLPLTYLDHAGLIHSDSESPDREAIVKKMKRLITKLGDYCPFDACADQMGKEFVHSALPPVLSHGDILRGANSAPNANLHAVLKGYKNKYLGIKLIRAYACRLVSEDDSLRLYYTTHNSLEYHGEDPMYVDLPLKWAAMTDSLIRKYPDFTDVRNMAAEGGEPCRWSDIVDFTYELWKKGLILFDRPLKDI